VRLTKTLLICGAPSPGNVFHRFDEIRRKFQLDPFAPRATIAQPLAVKTGVACDIVRNEQE
jgi:hypothetical protein